MSAQRFGAPWGRDVKIVTLLGLGAMLGPFYVVVAHGAIVSGTVLTVINLVILSLCVRGYELSPGELRIQRLLWWTRWPLDPSTRAIVRPHAMKGSWRTWGNGGMLAISGHFSGSGLGRYRAFVTDPKRTVVLETQRGIVVVSPDDPQSFADYVTTVVQGRSR
jgi:hypothetical protein